MFKRIKSALLRLPLAFLVNIIEDMILDAIEDKIRESETPLDDKFALPLVRLIRHLLNGLSLEDAMNRVFSDASEGEQDITELAMSRLKDAIEAEQPS